MASDRLPAVRSASSIACLALALLLSPGEALTQQQGPRGRSSGIPMHYEDVEVSTIIDEVARATGRRFVYGDNVRGRVTITVPERVTPDESLELLFAALFLKGFTAIPLDEETIRIVPVLETTTGAPVVERAENEVGDRPITTLIELEEITADQAAEALAPYVARNALALAHPATNNLILAGTEAQLVRLITIARVLDRAAHEQLLVRTLRYRRAGLAAEMVDTVFNHTPVEANHVEIWTDDRTDQLIVRGHPAVLQEIRRFLEGFDRPVEGEGLVRVVWILNRDAEEIAEILGSLAGPAPVAAAPRPRAASRGAAPLPDVSTTLMGRSYRIEVDVHSHTRVPRAAISRRRTERASPASRRSSRKSSNASDTAAKKRSREATRTRTRPSRS